MSFFYPKDTSIKKVSFGPYNISYKLCILIIKKGGMSDDEFADRSSRRLLYS